MKKDTLSVPDISCNHCKMAIEGAVKGLKGIASVRADVPGKTVDVEYDDKTVSINDIAAAIEEQGYSIKR